MHTSEIFNYSAYLKHWKIIISMNQDYGYFGNVKLLLQLNLEDWFLLHLKNEKVQVYTSIILTLISIKVA